MTNQRWIEQSEFVEHMHNSGRWSDETYALHRRDLAEARIKIDQIEIKVRMTATMLDAIDEANLGSELTIEAWIREAINEKLAAVAAAKGGAE